MASDHDNGVMVRLGLRSCSGQSRRQHTALCWACSRWKQSSKGSSSALSRQTEQESSCALQPSAEKPPGLQASGPRPQGLRMLNCRRQREHLWRVAREIPKRDLKTDQRHQQRIPSQGRTWSPMPHILNDCLFGPLGWKPVEQGGTGVPYSWPLTLAIG